jgi:FAD/FMN-containing dehydrogenase
MELSGKAMLIGQRTFMRGAPGYEAARRATVWNARLPERYPDVIVQAKDVYDVVAAVKLANRKGLRIGVRSGGHSWSGNHVRDGGLLLDVSRLDEVSLDTKNMRATVGPGLVGHELARMLARHDLFFPTGHCRGVGLGGYLLQGGFGWLSRVLGPACKSVVAIDVVTANGELIHASADENPELYWAARGAGPGFFGVAVRFHLRLYAKPKVIGVAIQSYPIGMMEEVFRWAHKIGPEVPAAVEMQLMMKAKAIGVGGPGIEVYASVLSDGLRSALRALDYINKSELRKKASLKMPFIPSTIGLMHRSVSQHYPDGRRYAVDNMWTHASIDELLPGLYKIAATLPPPPSHLVWINWASPPERPDMAFSLEDDIYLGLYSAWTSAADDARYASWAVDRVREMAHLASGCQLADENLGQRPARFMSDENLQRLDQIRAMYDPQGRFFSWMGRP